MERSRKWGLTLRSFTWRLFVQVLGDNIVEVPASVDIRMWFFSTTDGLFFLFQKKSEIHCWSLDTFSFFKPPGSSIEGQIMQ